MKTNRHFLITGIVCGALLALAPFVGVLGTVLGLMREFHHLERSAAYAFADPSTFSGQAGGALIPTIAGVLLCPVGIALLSVCLKHLRRLPPASSSPLHAS